ncbi:hypothetical protein [Larkinella soli]|uniref:hypothetical protein n=1 Tax=Larkinella soli TaxID=1770527 RepID=UPI001E3898D2|nr:hypothetical protein [Larkinella soli]
MNLLSLRAYSLCLLLLLLMTEGCRPKRKTEDQPPAAKPAGIDQIHFFMETSASMGGYLRGGTEFKDVVSEVITKANTIRPVTIWTIAEQAKRYEGTPADFVTDLATTPLATERSSKLHTIFDRVGKQAAGNNIALLVSDCILSFPDEEIRKNREINRTDASSVLKNNIYDEFSRLKRQGISATVYAFRSQFNGTYYDYRNTRTALSGESRPFYLWAIGRQELLVDFNRKLQDMLTTRPAKILDFSNSTALNRYELFFSLNKKGEWRAKNNNITELEARPGKPAEFALGLDLSGLPTYAQAEDFLKKNLAISSKDAAVKLLSVQKKENVPTEKRLSEREERLLNQSTHVLTFRVDNMFAGEAAVTARLPVRFDNWYEKEWTTMDDRIPAERQNKTFALQHLMNGVKEAYQSSTNDFLVLNFKLVK